MAVWKKLNAETGEYEKIPGSGCNTDDTESEKHYYKLVGKTAIFMGDSYTRYMSTIFKNMCAEFEMVSDNRGIASSTITGDTSLNKGYQAMWMRTEEVCAEYIAAGTTDNVALIVFMGGANDGFGRETWLGTSIADTNEEHIYGAMHSILNNFRKTFPNAKIITILQPANYNCAVANVNDDATAQILGFADLASLQKMDDYQYSNYGHFQKQKVVEEVAKFYGTSIVDCCFDWYSVLNANDRAKYWLDDKLHLTTDGHEEVAQAVRERILEICAD